MKRIKIVMFCSLVLDLLAFTLILPLLPSIMDYYGNSKSDDVIFDGILSTMSYVRNLMKIPDSNRLNSVLLGGILGSMFSMLQFISSPILGALSDVYGRKPMLLLTMLGSGLSYAVWAYSSTFSMFLLSRVIGGLSKGNVGIAMAVVSDTTDERTRGSGLALIGIAFSIAFLLGPSVGAFFSILMRSDPIGFYRVPAFVSLSLLFTAVLVVAIFLPESLPPSKRRKYTIRHIRTEALSMINPLWILRFTGFKASPKGVHKQLTSTGAVLFLYLFIYSGLEFTLTFLVHLRFSYVAADQGKMFMFIGLLMIIIQGSYVRRVPPEKMKTAVLQAFIALATGFVIIGVSANEAFFYVGLVMFAFASATVVSHLTTIISLSGNAINQGRLLGICRAIGAFARGTGPFFASTVFWIIGPTNAYIFGAALMLVPIFLLMKKVS